MSAEDKTVEQAHQQFYKEHTNPVTDVLPAPILNPEAWPERYADGFNDCALLALQEATTAYEEQLGIWAFRYEKEAILKEFWKQQADTSEKLLKKLYVVLGPSVAPCCDGCRFEWAEALRLLKQHIDSLPKQESKQTPDTAS